MCTGRYARYVHLRIDDTRIAQKIMHLQSLHILHMYNVYVLVSVYKFNFKCSRSMFTCMYILVGIIAYMYVRGSFNISIVVYIQ